MKTYHVKFSMTAQTDIYNIVQYIQLALQEPGTAVKLYWKIKEEINSLSQLPERCPLVDIPDIRELGVRRLLIQNYSVFYVVDQKQSVVKIARVIYAGRDIEKQLEPLDWETL